MRLEFFGAFDLANMGVSFFEASVGRGERFTRAIDNFCGYWFVMSLYYELKNILHKSNQIKLFYLLLKSNQIKLF